MAGELREMPDGIEGNIGIDPRTEDPSEATEVSDAGLKMGREYFEKIQEPHILRGENGEKLKLPKDIKSKVEKMEKEQKERRLEVPKQEIPEE